MKKTNLAKEAPNPKNLNISHIDKKDRLPLVFFMLYTLAELLPGTNSTDVIGDQWLYIAIINLLALLAMSVRSNLATPSTINAISKKAITLIYGALILLSMVSIFVSLNKIESLVVLSRMLNTFAMYFILACLLYGRLKLLRPVAVLLSAFLLYQSLLVLQQFYNGINEGNPVDQVIYGLKLNAANKNILAAQLVFKSTLVLYCVYTSKTILGRLFFSLILLPASLSIFIINARASFVGLILVMISFLVTGLLVKYGKSTLKELLVTLGAPFFSILLAFILSGPILKAAISDEANAPYGTVTERLGTINLTAEGTNARIQMWEAAVDHISKHPVLGAGIGNWKFVSIPYERENVDELLVAYHVHNDFLEITAETGILGGLLFIALFFAVFAIVVRVLLKREQTSIALFLLPALIAYGIDSFFNFPLERTVMQFYFALVLGCSVASSGERPEQASLNRGRNKWTVLAPLVLLLLPALYIVFQTSRSFTAQARVNKDILQTNTQNKYDDIKDELPSIPNINAYTFPIAQVKAIYLINEKRYEEAMKLINGSEKVNPYLTLAEYLKAKIYFQTGRLDSARYYANKAFYLKPRAKSHYSLLSSIVVQQKDSMELTHAFREFVKYRNEPDVWNSYIINMIAMNGEKREMIVLADSALKLFPADTSLLNTKRTLQVNARSLEYYSVFQEAMASFNNRNFNRAIELFSKAYEMDHSQYLSMENIGLCYYSLNRFDQAIKWFEKVIDSRLSSDGKSEFFKGASLINMGKSIQSCPFLRVALNKGYSEAGSLMEKYCK